jgi:ATP-dependent helicase IRC3
MQRLECFVTSCASVHEPPPHTYILRPYQKEAIARALDAFARENARILIALPTGSGKTVVFAHIILAMIANGGRALALVHRDELLELALAKLRDVLPPEISIGAIKAERDEASAQVIVASVQTLSRENRLARIGNGFVVVVVDEAHHATAETYRRILAHLNILDCDPLEGCPQLLGVTATVDRGDGVGLAAVFEQVVYELPLLPMIEDQYLSDLTAVAVDLKADYSDVSVRGGDYAGEESGRVFAAANGPQHVAAAIHEHAAGRKSLAFLPTVRAAHDTAEAINALGIVAAAVDGETPLNDRRSTFQAFRNGSIQALANCGICTEGYDEPSISSVVVARPTKSRALYAQMIGRGTRRFPGKDDCLIIDMVGASRRHDLMTAPDLFGFPLSVLKQANGSIVGATALQASAESVRQASGELIARTIDLFRRRMVHWAPTANGRFVLSTGEGSIVLRPSNGETWDAVYAPTGGTPETIASQLTLGYAQGVAEDFARTLGARALIAKGASWRDEEPTTKQLWKLHHLGVPVRDIRTRGEASDLISAAVAQGAA